MSPDIQAQLRRAMPESTNGLDIQAVRRGGRRLRFRRRAVSTVAAIAVFAGGAYVLPRLDAGERNQGTVQPAAPAAPRLPNYDLTHIGVPTVLADGKQQGTVWELAVSGTKSGRYCAEFRLGEDAAFGSFDACATYVPEFESLSVLRGYFSTHDELSPIVGPVSTDAKAVAVHLSNGEVVAAEIIDAPAGSSSNFFIAFADPDLDGNVVATDAGGDVIERDPVDVCRGGLVSSCGHRAPDRSQ